MKKYELFHRAIFCCPSTTLIPLRNTLPVFSGKQGIPPSRLGHHDLGSKLAYCRVTSLLGNKLYYFCILFTIPSISLVTEVSPRRNRSENNSSTLLSGMPRHVAYTNDNLRQVLWRGRLFNYQNIGGCTFGFYMIM